MKQLCMYVQLDDYALICNPCMIPSGDGGKYVKMQCAVDIMLQHSYNYTYTRLHWRCSSFLVMYTLSDTSTQR